MGRIHLFELEDLSWYPRVLREGTTLYLETIQRLVGLPRLFAPKLRKAVERSKRHRLVDLGSGAGGPVRQAVALVAQELDQPLDVTLTDLRPNMRAIEAFEAVGVDDFRYLKESIDASRVPPHLSGVRTMFASFHHLKVDAARKVLADAYRMRQPICVFEITDPTPTGLFACTLMPVYAFALMPFVRPLSASQLFFTYVVPLLPFAIAWDGFVSTLRTYSVSELKEMTRDLQDDSYEWEIGTIPDPRLPLQFPYALGLPRISAQQATGASQIVDGDGSLKSAEL